MSKNKLKSLIQASVNKALKSGEKEKMKTTGEEVIKKYYLNQKTIQQVKIKTQAVRQKSQIRKILIIIKIKYH